MYNEDANEMCIVMKVREEEEGRRVRWSRTSFGPTEDAELPQEYGQAEVYHEGLREA